MHDRRPKAGKDKFITEKIASIGKYKEGLWAVRFTNSSRWFNYNPSRLLYLTNPEVIDIGEKGLYVKNSISPMCLSCPALAMVDIHFIE